MKALMFGWEFPPHISGGLGTACYGITMALLQQGMQVIFVVPRLYGDEHHGRINLLDANEVLNEIGEPFLRKWHESLEYINVESTLTPYASVEAHDVLTDEVEKTQTTEPLKSRFEFSGKYGPQLLQEVQKYALVASTLSRDHEHDIIHVHDWLTFPAGIAAKKVSGKPLIAHVHATEYDRSGEQVNQQIYEIEKEGLQQADMVIAVSEYTRQIIISKYNILPEKIAVAHNGIIPKANSNPGFAKNIKEKVVTFMGRITHQKGPEYFIEAANKVLKRISNVRFVMAGNGDMTARMIERVAALKLSSRFHFTGFLKGPDVDKMYALTDVYVMPSVSEPFGIAPLEAVQANVPVIISRQSGVSEVLKHAIKVDFWNTDALADAISALLQYKSLSEVFRKNGKHEIIDMKWENTGSKIKNVYQSLINETAE